MNGLFFILLSKLAGKASTDSPAFTGTPTAPTAASGTDTTQLATTEFVQDAIAAIPASAGYPLSDTPAWNTQMFIFSDGEEIITPAVILPAIPENMETSLELRVIFMTDTGTAIFTAPSTAVLLDGDTVVSPGGTLQLTGLDSSALYEFSFVALSPNIIGLVKREWGWS